jgi:preprotein translocase subunit YajC
MPILTTIMLAAGKTASHAASKSTNTSSASGTIFYLLFLVAIGYLLWRMFMRPQSQRAKQQRQLASEIAVGDDVLTTSGIFGVVTEIEPDRVTLEVAPETSIVILRTAIAQRLTPALEEEGSDWDDAAEDSAGHPGSGAGASPHDGPPTESGDDGAGDWPEHSGDADADAEADGDADGEAGGEDVAGEGVAGEGAAGEGSGDR